MSNPLNQILAFENAYCEVFSTVEKRKYGTVFHDKNNPLSWDSNHARIDDFTDIKAAVDDIIRFYHAINIKPRIYVVSNKITRVDKYLKNTGFCCLPEKRLYLVQKKSRHIQIKQTLVFKRLCLVDESIEKLILTDKNDGVWSYKTLRAAINKQNFYLFAGYENHEAATIASVNVSNASGRIDHVFTDIRKRNRGFCSQLMNFITTYNRQNLKVLLYLFSDNPAAIKIYKKCGYKPVKTIWARNYWLEP